MLKQISHDYKNLISIQMNNYQYDQKTYNQSVYIKIINRYKLIGIGENISRYLYYLIY